MTMRFAVGYSTPYYGVDPDRIIASARHAEACGFEALYLPEHIVLYPGTRVGHTELPPSLPYADPLDCLASSPRPHNGSRRRFRRVLRVGRRLSPACVTRRCSARLATFDDVARVAAFVASDHARTMTSATINTPCGRSLTSESSG
jgi:hypothetical protein